MCSSSFAGGFRLSYYVHLRSVLSDSSKIYYVHHRVHTQLSGCGVAQSGLGRWTHNPEIEGSNPSPATKVEACDVRGKVFSGLSDVRGSAFLLRNANFWMRLFMPMLVFPWG